MESIEKQPKLIDLSRESFEQQIQTEGRVYVRKNSPIKNVRQVVEREIVHTYMPDGTLESTHEASPGDWVVTGPEGEEFVFTDEKLQSLYQQNSDGTFSPRERRVWALKNPTGTDIRICAPWGTEENPAYQDGTPECIIVVSLDQEGNMTEDRYLIGTEAILHSNYLLVE